MGNSDHGTTCIRVGGDEKGNPQGLGCRVGVRGLRFRGLGVRVMV